MQGIIVICFILHRIIYWSDIGSNPPRIKSASMDGSGVGTVVPLYSANDDYTFPFTLDYSQQMLYWVNSSSSCYYTIETASIDGSGRRIIYKNNVSMFGSCTNNSYYHYSQAIDFFGGAVYTYLRYHKDIVKTVVENTPKIVTYDNVNWYVCNSTYTAMKVISPERQLQGITDYVCLQGAHTSCKQYEILHTAGINPCAINNGGCAHLCLLSVNNSRNYTCACHNGTLLHQNGHDCIGIVITLQ